MTRWRLSNQGFLIAVDGAARDVVREPAAEVVENGHPDARGQKGFCDVRPDETGSAGDEDFCSSKGNQTPRPRSG